jgi:hypothetical protein
MQGEAFFNVSKNIAIQREFMVRIQKNLSGPVPDPRPGATFC